MKALKQFCAASLSVIAFSAFAAGEKNIEGGSGTITLSGTIAAAACTVSLDRNSVKFPEIEYAKLKEMAVGNVVGDSQDVSFTFSDCKAEDAFTLALTANHINSESDSVAGNVVIAGEEAPALLYSVKAGGKKLLLNGSAQNVELDGSTLTLGVELVRGADEHVDELAGDFSASVSYVVSYN